MHRLHACAPPPLIPGHSTVMRRLHATHVHHHHRAQEAGSTAQHRVICPAASPSSHFTSETHKRSGEHQHAPLGRPDQRIGTHPPPACTAWPCGHLAARLAPAAACDTAACVTAARRHVRAAYLIPPQCLGTSSAQPTLRQQDLPVAGRAWLNPPWSLRNIGGRSHPKPSKYLGSGIPPSACCLLISHPYGPASHLAAWLAYFRCLAHNLATLIKTSR